MDFAKNATHKSWTSGSDFLDAMATDSHRDFQHDQWRDPSVLRGGDGAGGGSARRYQPAVPVGCLYQTQTICLATTSTGRRDGGDSGDYFRLYRHDDVADVDSGSVGPDGNDWVVS